MSATDTRTDAKRGYCTFCRNGTHALCAAPACACPARGHANRPDAKAPTAAGRAGVKRPPRAEPTTLAEPVWELVRADPPAPPPRWHRPTAVERARPLLERLAADANREWHRIALFPSRQAASHTKGRLAKAYRREWEWHAVSVPDAGQSAVYVRWLGDTPGPLA